MNRRSLYIFCDYNFIVSAVADPENYVIFTTDFDGIFLLTYVQRDGDGCCRTLKVKATKTTVHKATAWPFLLVDRETPHKQSVTVGNEPRSNKDHAVSCSLSPLDRGALVWPVTSLNHFYIINCASNDRKLGQPIIYTDTLLSIHKNRNNAWNNKAYSLITKTH